MGLVDQFKNHKENLEVENKIPIVENSIKEPSLLQRNEQNAIKRKSCIENRKAMCAQKQMLSNTKIIKRKMLNKKKKEKEDNSNKRSSNYYLDLLLIQKLYLSNK